ncbi:MAG: hypothetical protein SFU83_12100 [Meiothermus sp.]|nr:hypothetical protein [Meiothermus sp.]
MDENALIALLQSEWGSLKKPYKFGYDDGSGFRLYRSINFSELTDDAKARLCEIAIIYSSPNLGSMISDEDIPWVLSGFATDLAYSSLATRRKIPLVTAINIILEKPRFLNLLGLPFFNEHFAVVTPYLIAELELWTRINSPYLNFQGLVTKEIPKTVAAPKRHKQKAKKRGTRENRIGVALRSMLFRNKSDLAQRIKRLDRGFKAYEVMENGNPRRIESIADRIDHTRNLIMHGEANLIPSEAYFFAFLLAIYFYSMDKSVLGS